MGAADWLPWLFSCGTGLFDHARDFIHDRFRRRIDFRDQDGEVLTVLGLKIELRFLGLRDESRIGHGSLECVAQHFEPVRRQVRRRAEWAPDTLTGVEEFDRLSLLAGECEIEHERYAVEPGIGL